MVYLEIEQLKYLFIQIYHYNRQSYEFILQINTFTLALTITLQRLYMIQLEHFLKEL